MDIDRSKVIKEAKTWLNTPWAAQAKAKGAGVDCINFLAACGEVVDILVDIPLDYKRRPVDNSLHTYLSSLFTPTTEPQPADLIVFKYQNLIAHVGLYLGEEQFIHAYCHTNPRHSKVQIDRLDEYPYSWRKRVAYFLDIDTYTC